jgi:hypothetical protein
MPVIAWLLKMLLTLTVSVACGVVTHTLLEHTVQASEPYAEALLRGLHLPTPSRETLWLGTACSIVLLLLISARLAIRCMIALRCPKRIWLSAILLLIFAICTDFVGLLQSHEGWNFVVTAAAKLRADFLTIKGQFCVPD